MAVWKRYNGKRVKGEGPKGKGTWIVEFRLRGHYVKQAIPEARTRAEAEQAQTKIKRDIFDDKYNRAAGNKDFSEFVDDVFVPWAKASKKSWQDDEERARQLKARISGLRFHDLRHTFATRLRAKGVHEMDIMTLLGHTTLQMTSRYTHAMPQNLRTAVDSLNKQPLPFRPRSAPRSRQLANGTDGN